MKTKNEMLNIINLIFRGSKKPDNQLIEIPVTQYGFIHNLYEDALEVAIHIAIASASIFTSDENTPLRTSILTDDIIYSFMGFDSKSRNGNKNYKKVYEAIEGLENKGIIRKIKLDSVRYYIEQSLVDGKKLFFNIDFDDFIKITLCENNNNKIKLLATLAALVTNMNKVNVKNFDYSNNLKVMNQASQALSWKRINTLSESIGLSRNTTNKYINLLNELNVIEILQVRHPYHKQGEWANYYSKYRERYYLQAYFTALINSNSQNEKEQINDINTSPLSNRSNIHSEASNDTHEPIHSEVNETSVTRGIKATEVSKDDSDIINSVDTEISSNPFSDDKDLDPSKNMIEAKINHITQTTYFDIFKDSETEDEQIATGLVEKAQETRVGHLKDAGDCSCEDLFNY